MHIFYCRSRSHSELNRTGSVLAVESNLIIVLLVFVASSVSAVPLQCNSVAWEKKLTVALDDVLIKILLFIDLFDLCDYENFLWNSFFSVLGLVFSPFLAAPTLPFIRFILFSFNRFVIIFYLVVCL